MLKRKQQGDSGFTLIEVLVVVIILGILAAIVTVAVSNARQRAVAGACTSSAGSLKSALDLYFVNNNGLYPGGKDADGDQFAKTDIDTLQQEGLLETVPPYKGDSDKDFYLVASLEKFGTNGDGTDQIGVKVVGYKKTAATAGSEIDGCLVPVGN